MRADFQLSLWFAGRGIAGWLFYPFLSWLRQIGRNVISYPPWFAPAWRSLGGFYALSWFKVHTLLSGSCYEDKCGVFIFMCSGDRLERRATQVKVASAI